MEQDSSVDITNKKRSKDSKSTEVPKKIPKIEDTKSNKSTKLDSEQTTGSKLKHDRPDRSLKSRSPEPGKSSKRSSKSNFPRCYNNGIDRIKENSDSYWNKYPKKESVGIRHYDSGKDTIPEDGEVQDEIETKAPLVRQRKQLDLLTSKTGGAYIPPAKLRMMQAEITDKSSTAYQRLAWEALKKSIHGYVNKINTSNIGIIAKEVLQENIVRGRGLLCKSIIQAQAASPTFTHVYSALVAVINSKFPGIGILLLKRLVIQFKRGFKQNNKNTCITAASFIAHLVNQRVAHEILALEILTLLVETPTDDSVEVAISFLKECGQKLTEVSSKGISAIFEMLRNILHEGKLEKRIQYMIEVMFQIRKDGFKDHAAIIEDLDLIEEDDQITHLITLEDVELNNADDILNVFQFDEKYEENESKYQVLSGEILTKGIGDSESGTDAESGEEEEDEENSETNKDASLIIDNTETNLIALRRTIYLTIQSSLDFEESAHKLMKMDLKPGQEIELCHMFLDCCAEQRTYEKFYGLLAQRFCQINTTYVEPFQQIFKDTYATTHRLDTNRLRNVSKFFAHLLFTDAISWEVLDIIKLNEEDTNSSSRIFIKIVFQELSEFMGLENLNKRLNDPTLQNHFAGLFPRDNPKNTRFSVNFFTSIGLGGLTDALREHLNALPKVATIPNVEEESSSSDDSDNESSSSSDSSSSSSDTSDDKNSSKKKQSKEKLHNKKQNKTQKKPSGPVKNPKDIDVNKKEYRNERDKHRKDKRGERELVRSRVDNVPRSQEDKEIHDSSVRKRRQRSVSRGRDRYNRNRHSDHYQKSTEINDKYYKSRDNKESLDKGKTRSHYKDHTRRRS